MLFVIQICGLINGNIVVSVLNFSIKTYRFIVFWLYKELMYNFLLLSAYLCLCVCLGCVVVVVVVKQYRYVQ